MYSIDVRENVAVPRLLIDLGREVVGGEGMPVHYRFLQKDHLSVLLLPLRIVGSNYGLFGVSEDSGKLELTASPDREQRDMYILRVKVAVAFSLTSLRGFLSLILVSRKEEKEQPYNYTISVVVNSSKA